MPGPQPQPLRLGQPFGGVGAQRLQQVEPALGGLYQRLLHEPGQHRTDGRGGSRSSAHTVLTWANRNGPGKTASRSNSSASSGASSW